MAPGATVVIEPMAEDIRQNVEHIMATLAPQTFAGATVLIKPNMVGPSTPDLGHTTHPGLVRAVVRACRDRNAQVIVGDNPGGLTRSARTVAAATGIEDASEGCFAPISERVVEKTGEDTGFPIIVSRAVLEADYVINLPVFKTHVGTIVTGAIKNTFGYVAGACKARLHLLARDSQTFARTVCDIYRVRPPDLNIIDGITAIEGNGPCHGGRQRRLGKLLASRDALAADSVMIRMMGVDPAALLVQQAGQEGGFGALDEADIDARGPFEVIPDFKMPITFAREASQGGVEEIRRTYPGGMMANRVTAKPVYNPDLCTECGDCELHCPPQALTLEPEFTVTDDCIACFCCVELCPSGALEVPDIEAFRHY